MKKRPIQIQLEFFEKVWTNNNVDAVFDYFDGEAGGLGTSEPLDPVGYIDFYHALSSVVKDVEFEVPRWIEKDNQLYIQFLMKGRARKKDKAIFWHGAAMGYYKDGKIAGGENFLDFVDLFRQLELVPEQTVELGLAGEEILNAEQAGESLGPEFRRLFWPGYQALENYLPSSEQLDVLFSSAMFAMVTTDISDQIVDSNQRFIRLIGEKAKSFSSLVVGKGKEAERRAREALLQGEIPSYRILLNLQGESGPVRVWVSAVTFQEQGRPVRILRSVERDELIDDLVDMQEKDRRLLAEELNREVLEPVLNLWTKFSSRAANDPAVRVRCVQMATHLLDKLRAKIRNLRNPILEGVPLSRAWPERELDRALDDTEETVALLAYRLVGECTAHFRSELVYLVLETEDGWLKGALPVEIGEELDRLHLLRNLCDLVGGRLSVETEEGRSVLGFWLPHGGR